jgi:hypothetical protein
MTKKQIYKTLNEIRDNQAYSNLLETVEVRYYKFDKLQILSAIQSQMNKFRIERVRIQEPFS